MDLRIVTSVCTDDDTAGDIRYPQLGTVSSAQRFGLYWGCAACCLATARRSAPDTPLELVVSHTPTSTPPPDYLPPLLARLGVTVRAVPFERFASRNLESRKFRNNFFKLEALAAAVDADPAPVALIDADCVVTGSIERLTGGFPAPGTIGIYPGTVPPELTTAVLDAFADLLPDAPRRPAPYVNGEYFAGHAADLERFVKVAADGFQRVVELGPAALARRLPNGDTVFDNDEYLETWAFSQLDEPLRDARDVVRRIWTNVRRYDARESDLLLEVWHLPGEKVRGFTELLALVLDPTSDFWRVAPADLPRWLGRFFGVPSRPLSEQLRWAWQKLPRRLRAVGLYPGRATRA